jgi:hypothetical protein
LPVKDKDKEKSHVQDHLDTILRVLATLEDKDQRAALVVRTIGGARAADLFDLFQTQTQTDSKSVPAPSFTHEGLRLYPEVYREFVARVLEANRNLAAFDHKAFATSIGF